LLDEARSTSQENCKKIFCIYGTTKENARQMPDTFWCNLNRNGGDYFFLLSTMHSIPMLDNLTEITTPNKKIVIGTKSSIGIAHSPVLLRDLSIKALDNLPTAYNCWPV